MTIQVSLRHRIVRISRGQRTPLIDWLRQRFAGRPAKSAWLLVESSLTLGETPGPGDAAQYVDAHFLRRVRPSVRAKTPSQRALTEQEQFTEIERSLVGVTQLAEETLFGLKLFPDHFTVQRIAIDGHLQGTGAAAHLVHRLRDALAPGQPIVISAASSPASRVWLPRMLSKYPDWYSDQSQDGVPLNRVWG